MEMLDELLLTIAKGVSMEPFSLILMLILCAVSAYLLAQMVPSPAIMMFGFPMLTVGALLGNWAFRWLKLTVVADKYTNSVLATGLGLIFTLGVITVLTLVTTWFEPMPERDDVDSGPPKDG